MPRGIRDEKAVINVKKAVICIMILLLAATGIGCAKVPANGMVTMLDVENSYNAKDKYALNNEKNPNDVDDIKDANDANDVNDMKDTNNAEDIIDVKDVNNLIEINSPDDLNSSDDLNNSEGQTSSNEHIDQVKDFIQFESGMEPLSSAMFLVDNPTAPGKLTFERNGARLDYSNTVDGYIMFAFVEGNAPTLSAKIIGPTGVAYDYLNIKNDGTYDIFPLSDGNGTYRFALGKLLQDGRWAQVMDTSFEIKLVNEFAPFLRPNTIIDYRYAPNTVKKAYELISGKKELVPKISSVYNYLVDNFKYDYNLAADITNGRSYRPVLDTSLANGKGVCYDYAALMTAMLRSQGIPCRLVMGYQGTVYHAWIDAYSNETGWINSIVRFEGDGWKLMDPTYASTGGEEGMKIANDPKNYVARFLY